MAATLAILLFLALPHSASFGFHVDRSFAPLGDAALRRRVLSAGAASGAGEGSRIEARHGKGPKAAASRELLDHSQTCPEQMGSSGNRAQTGGIAVPNPLPVEHPPPPYYDHYDYGYGYYEYYDDADEDNNTDPWDFMADWTAGAGTSMPMGSSIGSVSSPPQSVSMCPDVGYTFARGVIMSARQADSTLECHGRCLSERACASWSWVDPQRAVDRDDLGMCYLKYECDFSTLFFTDNGLWDGWPGCQVRDSKKALDVFHGWVCPGAGYEYVGGTYNTFRTSSACSCQALCAEQNQCQAWTWYAEADNICNLKNGLFSLEAVASEDIHAGTRNCTW